MFHAQKLYALAGEAARDLVGAVARPVGDDEDLHELARIVEGEDGVSLRARNFSPLYTAMTNETVRSLSSLWTGLLARLASQLRSSG